MGKEIEVSGEYVNVNRALGKEVERAKGRALAGQANAAAAESTAAYRTRLRNANAYDLASDATSRATMLHNQITHSARGNPGLEANLRAHIEEPVMFGAGMLIARYMHRT
jgi:hypothetical protein